MARHTISSVVLASTLVTATVHAASEYTCISQTFDFSTCETDQAKADFGAPCAAPICLPEECCHTGNSPGHSVSVSHWSDPVWLSKLPSGAPSFYPSAAVPLQGGDTGSASTPAGSSSATGTPSDTAPTASPESIAKHANLIETEALAAVTEYAGESLPAPFVEWLQDSASDFIRYSILSARHPHLVLIAVRSMQIDLGEADWTTYLQLVLARAIVDGGAHWESRADFDARYSLAARPPITLTIPGDERVVVDCSLPENLDDDCHIINFLNSRQITADRTTYDGDTAIETEGQTRNLWPSDVVSSQTLTEAFDSYMAANGVDFRINILASENSVYEWDRRWEAKDYAAGGGKHGYRKRMTVTFERFRTAMENKGQLPARNTYYPERILSGAQLILFYKHIAGQDTAGNVGLASGAPPLGLFPVTTAPWPILTWLAQPKQSLRGLEQLWSRYKQTGNWRLYGEYAGDIAFHIQSLRLRRMAPMSYGYGSMQMYEKDAGVCGTMCHMAMYSHDALGYPSSNTGQPKHCMLASWYPHPPPNASSGQQQQFYYKPMQSVGKWFETSPNKVFPFGDWETARYIEDAPETLQDATLLDKQRNPLAWTLGVGAGANEDKEAFVRSLIANRLAASLSEADRAAYGLDLYLEIVRLSPFYIGNIHKALDLAKSPFDALKVIDVALQTPGFATQNAEYPTWVRQLVFMKIFRFNVAAMSLEDRGVLLARMEALNAPTDMILNLQLEVHGMRYVLDQRKAQHMAELANRRINYNQVFLRAGNLDQAEAMNNTLALFDTTPGLGDAASRAGQKTAFAQEMVDAIGPEGLFVARSKFETDLALDVFVQAGAVLPTVEDPVYYYRHACGVLAEMENGKLKKLYANECEPLGLVEDVCEEDVFVSEHTALKANCVGVAVDFLNALHGMSRGTENRPAAVVAAPLEGLCKAGCGEAVDRLLNEKYAECVDQDELVLIKVLEEAVCSTATQSTETCGQQLTEAFTEDVAGDVVLKQEVCDGGCMVTVPAAFNVLLKSSKGKKSERVKELKSTVQETQRSIKQTNKGLCKRTRKSRAKRIHHPVLMRSNSASGSLAGTWGTTPVAAVLVGAAVAIVAFVLTLKQRQTIKQSAEDSPSFVMIDEE